MEKKFETICALANKALDSFEKNDKDGFSAAIQEIADMEDGILAKTELLAVLDPFRKGYVPDDLYTRWTEFWDMPWDVEFYKYDVKHMSFNTPKEVLLTDMLFSMGPEGIEDFYWDEMGRLIEENLEEWYFYTLRENVLSCGLPDAFFPQGFIITDYEFIRSSRDKDLPGLYVREGNKIRMNEEHVHIAEKETIPDEWGFDEDALAEEDYYHEYEAEEQLFRSCFEDGKPIPERLEVHKDESSKAWYMLKKLEGKPCTEWY